jgi:hypothetical protein
MIRLLMIMIPTVLVETWRKLTPAPRMEVVATVFCGRCSRVMDDRDSDTD